MKPLQNFFALLTVVLLAGCGKTTEQLDLPSVHTYLPLEEGQIIYYTIDSMVFTNFGQVTTIRSYEAKDEVLERTVLDNGDTSFYVARSIRAAGQSHWSGNISYTVIKSARQIHITEETLRFIKMVEPLKSSYQWRGNSYLPYRPYNALYDFSNDEDMQYWNYEYLQVEQPHTVHDQTYSNTIKVLQAGDSVNVPIVFINGIAYKNHWEEIYAAGVGLIEKKVEMWEYQPQVGTQHAYKTGYGIHIKRQSPL